MVEESVLLLARQVKLLLTDVDGVLTDNGVYYSEAGEMLKRFSIRDGMGVERLRKICGIETGIITGELSPSVAKRAEKLKISELHLGIKDKAGLLDEITARRKIDLSQIAYIGDDVNDLEVMQKVGVNACPSDAMVQIKRIAHYLCENKGGFGAFREFAEFLIASRTTEALMNAPNELNKK